MKKLIWIAVALIVSCNQSKTDQEVEQADSPVVNVQENTTTIRIEAMLPWTVDANEGTKTRNKETEGKELAADSIISAINQNYPNVLLEKIKQSSDTIYLEVKESTFLTQQMGSSGPAQWLAEVVINLTSVRGIKFVDIQLEQGDHAGPGTWRIEDFKSIKEK